MSATSLHEALMWQLEIFERTLTNYESSVDELMESMNYMSTTLAPRMRKWLETREKSFGETEAGVYYERILAEQQQRKVTRADFPDISHRLRGLLGT